MGKSHNITQIEFVKNCLRKGEKRNAILGKFGKKWGNVSRTTFDRRLEAAKIELQDEHKAFQAKVEVEVAKEVEVRKLDIMDAMERKSILTQTARGELPLQKAIVVDKEIVYIDVVPDWADRRAAITELNKMEGDYAPIKQANVNPDGTPIDQPKVVMTAEQLLELKQSIESKK